MPLIAEILVGIVALLHLGFLILEMFLWERPIGLRVFGHSKSLAQNTKVLAKNQGLYNGFLSAGLAWGLYLGDEGTNTLLFFLGCVVVAGLYGAYTANPKILWVQALPGGLALMALLI